MIHKTLILFVCLSLNVVSQTFGNVNEFDSNGNHSAALGRPVVRIAAPSGGMYSTEEAAERVGWFKKLEKIGFVLGLVGGGTVVTNIALRNKSGDTELQYTPGAQLTLSGVVVCWIASRKMKEYKSLHSQDLAVARK